MKVLHIINSLNAGGAEKLITDALILYRKQGIEAEILLLNSHTTPLMDKLNQNGVPVHGLGEENRIYSPFNIFKIRRFLRKYDLAHVHLFPASYLTVFANILLGTKLVFTEHNTTNKRRKLKWLKPLEKFVYGRFDKTVSISDAVHESLIGHLGSSYRKIQKIYNGIDLDEIKNAKPISRTSIGCSDKNMLVLQVSSFTPQKDQKTLIKSMALLPENHMLILVGDGPLRKECEDLVRKLGLLDRVKFLGLRSDVPSLLKTVDIVVLSSHYEGLSLSSVEGLISGKPFIASDVPGLTEVVQGAGLLFPDSDEKELSECIKKLLNAPNYNSSVVSECEKRAEVFDIQKMVDNYILLYKNVLGKKT